MAITGSLSTPDRSGSEALQPAAAQLARPAEQRSPSVPFPLRDTGIAPGLTRPTTKPVTGQTSELPQVGYDARKISVEWKDGTRSQL
ncbi:hypothetical protein FS749_008450 [Ceratobasidium sp. UAMH 11750]|nr:hypothetical protein FS749_008450 [Ceratobasidium sp. UAMH 11750]